MGADKATALAAVVVVVVVVGAVLVPVVVVVLAAEVLSAEVLEPSPPHAASNMKEDHMTLRSRVVTGIDTSSHG